MPEVFLLFPLRGGVEAKGSGDVNLVPKAFPLLGKEKEVLERRLASI